MLSRGRVALVGVVLALGALFWLRGPLALLVMQRALARNLVLVERAAAMAARKGCTPSQLALAWLLHRGDDIVPIPGTKSRKRLEENAAADAIRLTPAEIAELDAALPPGAAEGGRYPDAMQPRWD